MGLKPAVLWWFNFDPDPFVLEVCDWHWHDRHSLEAAERCRRRQIRAARRIKVQVQHMPCATWPVALLKLTAICQNKSEHFVTQMGGSTVLEFAPPPPPTKKKRGVSLRVSLQNRQKWGTALKKTRPHGLSKHPGPGRLRIQS